MSERPTDSSSKFTQNGEWASNSARQDRRVVVTGIGLVTPLGNDTETTWNNLIASKSGVREMTIPELAERAKFPRLGDLRSEVGVAGFVDININEELKRYLPEDRVKLLKLKRVGDAGQLGLVASAQALTAARLLENGKIIDQVDKTRFGVRIGTLIGNAAHFTRISETIQDNYENPIHTGLRPDDTLIADPARISAYPSIVFGLEGPKETPIAACATGNLALIGAYQDIFAGDADVMLAGGVDFKIDPMGIGIFEVMGALSKDRSKTASKPLDQDHSGFVMAEGAGIFVLETYDHAVRRGAHIIAEFAGYSKQSDAKYDTAPTGHAAEYGLAETLMRAGLPDKGIIYINAHATGTEVGDGIEPEGYKKTLSRLPYNHEVAISATKASTGHTLGASGGIEAAFAVLAVDRGVVPPTINITKPIPEVEDMNIVPNDAQGKNVEIGINGNYAFGGAGAVTAFRKLR